MTTQQGLRHASARAIAGTADTYDGDLFAMFEAEATVPPGSTFNEAFLLWLNERNTAADTNIADAMQRFATSQSAYNWSSLGTFGSNGTTDGDLLLEPPGTDSLLLENLDKLILETS